MCTHKATKSGFYYSVHYNKETAPMKPFLIKIASRTENYKMSRKKSSNMALLEC